MKELSIEQKAQRYDEAIERARYWEKNPTVWSSDNICQKLFPELKESEDEKIRKQIISFLKEFEYDCYRNLDFSSWIAWLEKQGDKYDKIVEKAKSEKQRVLITETNGNVGIDWDTRSLADTKMLLEYGLDYIKKLEKQGEQKSDWSEEDEDCINQLIIFCENCMVQDAGAKRCAHWLKSLKGRVRPKQECGVKKMKECIEDYII